MQLSNFVNTVNNLPLVYSAVTMVAAPTATIASVVIVVLLLLGCVLVIALAVAIVAYR